MLFLTARLSWATRLLLPDAPEYLPYAPKPTLRDLLDDAGGAACSGKLPDRPERGSASRD